MGSNKSPNFGLTDSGVVWGLAIMILLALGLLSVLRHTFGSIRVTAGAGS